MSEDIYAKPDLTKKVRFQTEEKNGNVDICEDIDSVTIYDNCWAEGSTPPKLQDNTTEDQQQTISVSVPPEKRNLVRPAAVVLVLLGLLLLAVVVALVVLLIQDKSLSVNLTSERDQLQTNYSEMKQLNHNLTHKTNQLERDKENLTKERDELWTIYSEMKQLNVNLTSERDQLQTNYSEMKQLNVNLTQKTNQLERDKENLIKERDELQKQLETSFCPADWIRFNISCYLISTSKKSWDDSKQFCENEKAHLVIVSGTEEQRFLSSLGHNIWIGLNDKEKENVWKWVDGTEVTTTYWKNNQPDNGGSKGSTGEDCVHITDLSDLNNWNDLRCNDKLYFICEKILK
ncbi:asialoglycoprotein receptor 1-like [Lates calcarifer]|uniref:Asialoglycoprotein receptor 1-like n=1 Tax=Lates calcarifer TaxID=8187 RepID=A0AAJ7LFA6_LATCA|nr:asialoglycoprotein receptor 1-like [Lates calcarifer]